MVVLEKMIIRGFKNSNVIAEISFSKKQFSILYGANGVGKTTFLEIIYAIFNKNEKRLRFEKVNNVKIIYNNGTIVEINLNETEDGLYDWNEFDNSELKDLNIMYISTVRALNNYRGNFTPEALINYFKNNLDKSINIDSSYLEVVDIVNYINGTSHSIVHDSIMKNKNIFIQGINMIDIEKIMLDNLRLEDINKQYLINAIIKITSDYLAKIEKTSTVAEMNNIIEFSKDDIELLNSILPRDFTNLIMRTASLKTGVNYNYVNKIKGQINNYYNKFNKNKLIDDIFFEYTGKRIERSFDEKKKIFLDKLQINIKGIAKHDISKLSHGEKHLITLLSLIAIVGNKKNFILIDEPCIALDTMWQENLLKAFEKISSNPMLIATQSPYLSIDYMDSQVEITGGLN